MTHLTESREALAKALYVYAHREGRAERVRAWESDTIPRPMKDQRREWADALIASGAVIPADTLADDDALIHDELLPWCRSHEVEEPAIAGSGIRHTLRALAAALSPARTFSGTTHDGTPVVVTVHDAEGVADLAFADATGRFGPAVELSEEI